MIGQVHTKYIINIPFRRGQDWKKILPIKLLAIEPGPIEINFCDWLLTYKDIEHLKNILEKSNFTLETISCDAPETIVSAAALGLNGRLNIKEDKSLKEEKKSHLSDGKSLLFHQGTLRSGEDLEAEEDLLLLGDINPGATVSAGGDVMVWGRLLGIAHAGRPNNLEAKIIALELRPVQLRIANVVARGPKEIPEDGLTEEASLLEGEIVIKPAKLSSKRFN